MRRKRVVCLVVAAVAVCAAAGLLVLEHLHLLPIRTYDAAHFGIDTVHSAADGNRNGTDDYTDILLGARADAERHPTYDGTYYLGGYPPDDVGVCTDVVWRAFKQAGYSLRDMVDRDIRRRPQAYPKVKQPDSNIDFRRVSNLYVFLEEHALSLTRDVEAIAEWQPGDIVIFDDDRHIGIISDRRAADGKPYVIHNAGQPAREEPYLDAARVTGHYRFDATRVDGAVLAHWE